MEEGTHGLYYCQLEPLQDDILQGKELEELEELHLRAKALSTGFLGPFKVRPECLEFGGILVLLSDFLCARIDVCRIGMSLPANRRHA